MGSVLAACTVHWPAPMILAKYHQLSNSTSQPHEVPELSANLTIKFSQFNLVDHLVSRDTVFPPPKPILFYHECSKFSPATCRCSAARNRIRFHPNHCSKCRDFSKSCANLCISVARSPDSKHCFQHPIKCESLPRWNRDLTACTIKYTNERAKARPKLI